ncbi:hypothetical protein V8E55_004792 [Tylopilus felleus]
MAMAPVDATTHAFALHDNYDGSCNAPHAGTTACDDDDSDATCTDDGEDGGGPGPGPLPLPTHDAMRVPSPSPSSSQTQWCDPGPTPDPRRPPIPSHSPTNTNALAVPSLLPSSSPVNTNARRVNVMARWHDNMTMCDVMTRPQHNNDNADDNTNDVSSWMRPRFSSPLSSAEPIPLFTPKQDVHFRLAYHVVTLYCTLEPSS